MLSKKNRADKKTVERIFKEGQIINFPVLTFRFILTNSPGNPRISFIAPKAVSKLAFNRNLLRRRGYSALRGYINQFPAGLLGVFIFKKNQNSRIIINDEIKSILNKIN